MRIEKISSEYDGLGLEIAISVPVELPKGIVQFSHGMAEHKERYFGFMNYLSDQGYICVIHDHRGHGESVEDKSDYGFFYTEDEQAVIDDLHTVTKLIKNRYPDIPLYLFSHSMGTLVARGYLKKYDDEIDKIVLCGPPTYNSAANMGLTLAKLSKPFHKEKAPNQMLNRLAFKGFNDGNEVSNGWLSVNPFNVESYNDDPKCGFVFTTNGFINLFKLQKGAFETTGWQVKQPKLPIFVIAGEEDPVIGSKEKFGELIKFLNNVGYSNVKSKLYFGMRHEILNEFGIAEVYEDTLSFFEE